MPMDFDGVVERHSHFLVFETKNIGTTIPEGQLYTLGALQHPKSFTVMKIWGKEEPKEIEVIFPVSVCKEVKKYYGIDAARKMVTRWYQWANKH